MKLSEIKKGDFLFYSERPVSNYADSLVEIVEKNGELYPHTICVNWDGRYYDNSTYESDILLYSHFDENCWHPTTYSKSCGSPSKWMNAYYPLDRPSIIVPNSVYILTKSRYDGQLEIIGLYSSEELAKEALSLCPPAGEYEKYSYYDMDLDDSPEHPKGHKAYICSMTETHEVESIMQWDILRCPDHQHLFPSVYGNRVYCWALDEKHAEQIALGHFNK